MATTTTHYGFTKPGVNDYVDISVLNANYDNLDNVIYNNQLSAQASLADLAPEYDATATYSVGDYVTYNKDLYRCITAIATAEAFDDTKWTAVKVGGELKSHDARISTLEAGVELEGEATNSFEDGIDSYFKKVVSSIVPVQAGSGTPSPTNVRAISGFTECMVTDCGKNLINQPDVTVTSQYFGARLTLGAGTYNLSCHVKNTTDINGAVKLNTSGNTMLIGMEVLASSDTDLSGSFTLTDTTTLVLVVSGSRVGYNYVVTNIQLETGETPTEYEPYTANTATISFGSAGTVYGGTVDLISGKLVVDKGYIAPSTVIEVMTPIGAERWRIALNDLGITGVEGAFSSHFNAVYANNPGCFYITSSRDSLVVLPTDQSLNTKALADAWLQANNPQFVYKLATPQEYQLTPAQLRSLVGANRLTSSTGEVTEVEYIKNKTIAWLLDLIRA